MNFDSCGKGTFKKTVAVAHQGLEPRHTKVTFWSKCLRGGQGGMVKRTHPNIDLETLELKPFNPTIRSSGIGLYQTCKRKYMFEERLGLKTRGTYQGALKLGSWYHEIYDKLYQGASFQSASQSVAGALVDLEKELLQSCDERGFLPGGRTVEKVLTLASLDLQKALVMAAWTWNRHPLDFDKYEVLTTEHLIEVKYQTIRQPIRMRLDALLRKRGTNKVYIDDHKTTSKKPSDLIDTYRFAIQPKLYRIGAEALLEHVGWTDEQGGPLEVVGFNHNIIRKPTIRQKQKQTFDEYLEEVNQWYSINMDLAPDDPPFIRSPIIYNEPVMTEETLILLREASRAATANIDPTIYYRDPSGNACLSWNQRCPFLDLCSTPPSELEGEDREEV